MKYFSDIVAHLHLRFRAKPLGNAIAPLFKKRQSVLDIGCFDGVLSNYLAEKLELSVKGVDINIPKSVLINAKLYDGKKLPFKSNSFDCAMLIDVLHHSENPLQLLKEARRVSKKTIVLKDIYSENFFHYLAGILADLSTVFVGMRLPDKYFSKKEWRALIISAGLKISYIDYSFKINSIDPEKHIIMRLQK
ncbi:TPA: class I SAM-dependent methyltransferase [archaeon]|uniref:Class I SAM-dependent methyltransferase n=1 Tax=Candidatus Naiadarchaeum limnaeum TaxID=2756139 RepID=A0A832UUH5_9ARCH|nr:class I SAM-dependent methyltransferase [Candidatus Naiadarchaeum limnaeum]